MWNYELCGFFAIRRNIFILKVGLLWKRLLQSNMEQCVWREHNSKNIILPYIFFFIINFLIVSLLAKWPCLLGLSFVLLKVLPKAQAPRLFRELSEKPRLFPNKCHFLLQKQELFLPFVYPSTFLTSFALVHLRTEFSHITLAFSGH